MITYEQFVDVCSSYGLKIDEVANSKIYMTDFCLEEQTVARWVDSNDVTVWNIPFLGEFSGKIGFYGYTPVEAVEKLEKEIKKLQLNYKKVKKLQRLKAIKEL